MRRLSTVRWAVFSERLEVQAPDFPPGKLRNADFISIAREGNPQPSAPQALSPPERSDAQRTHFEGAKRRAKCSESFPLWGHNPPPTGGHNPRPEGPSTFPFTTLLHNLPASAGHNLRRQPRPFASFRPPYFPATAPTARMMRAMPRSCQGFMRRWKMRKAKRMEEKGSMAEIMLASVGRM